MLRALADVVVVGAETVRQEGYRPARAREAFAERRAAAGQGPAPAIAVVSGEPGPGLLPPAVHLAAGAHPGAHRRRRAARTGSPRPEKAGAEVVSPGTGVGVDPARAVRALAERGHTRLLTEGGPRLLGQFVAAGVLDELCLTLSPMLTAGDAQRIVGRAGGGGAGAVRPGVAAGGGRVPLHSATVRI